MLPVKISILFFLVLLCSFAKSYPSELKYQWPGIDEVSMDGKLMKNINSLNGESFAIAKRLPIVRNQRRPQSKYRRIVNSCCDSLFPGGPFGKGKRSSEISSSEDYEQRQKSRYNDILFYPYLNNILKYYLELKDDEKDRYDVLDGESTS